MVILLAGASGFLGSALIEDLAGTHEIRQLVRTPPQRPEPHQVVWDPGGDLPLSVFDGVNAVVNLGGAGIGDKRWSTARLQELRRSRTEPTGTLAAALARLDRPVRYLQASAVGIYGDTGESMATEAAPAGETILARLCQQWEAAAQPAVDAGHPVAFLRSGIVLSAGGGALQPLLRLIKLGVGGPLGSGRQWWPWIHCEDWVGAVRFLLDNTISGPVNVTAPQPARNRDLIREIARAHGRPSFVPAPSWALRLVLGPFAEELLSHQRVVPGALTEGGYSFRYSTAAEAAQALTR